MYYESKIFNKIGISKIIEMLTDHASSPGGASFCRRIKPMTDLNKIITAQEQTAAKIYPHCKEGNSFFQRAMLSPTLSSAWRSEVP